MNLILIAAVAENRVIGNKGNLPWPNISEDMLHFKNRTMGNPVIMGRTTFQSILQKLETPLKGRYNIVVSRNPDFKYPGIETARTIEEAVEKARQKGTERGYVIGGQQVYEQTIGIADGLEITEIHHQFSGDSFFPVIKPEDWVLYSRLNRSVKGINFGFSFAKYFRRPIETV